MSQHKVVTIKCAFCGEYVPRDDISMGGKCFDCAERGIEVPFPADEGGTGSLGVERSGSGNGRADTSGESV